jgi:hypothetical protein
VKALTAAVLDAVAGDVAAVAEVVCFHKDTTSVLLAATKVEGGRIGGMVY